MDKYIISVMCVSVVGSLASILAPDGEGGGISRNIRLIFGLCVVIVCINPIKDIISYISDFELNSVISIPEQESEKYNEIFEGAYGAAELDSLKDGIKQILSDRFEVDSSECEISVTLSEERRLERVCVTLYGSAVWKNTNEIESCLYKLLGCEIVTVIG